MILIKYHQVVNFLITNQPGLPVRFKKYFILLLFVHMSE